GTGELDIKYSINGAKYTNSGNQIVIPKLEPGTFNVVSVTPSDYAWKAKPVLFYIYIVPYLWQTPLAKKVIFILVLLALLGMVYIIIIFTRRITNQNNDRRNQRRELELKSIYSQI